ncbi:MBL fold metallo-hydrolase [Aerococcaceae bacterium DSM 111020]|nr:MBL fold metallo-hydrolase [Aerococcaceae bacterium DSM 111020]
MSTKITFWSGLDTIGANIVSLESEGYRLITDFGAYVGADVEALTNRGQTKFFYEANLLPPIEGIYPVEQLQDIPLQGFGEEDVNTIICLSHLHLDHIGSFGQLSEEVPVYTLADNVSFYYALSEQHLLPQYNVNWHGVQTGQAIQHGPFNFQFHVSDHDTLGAAALFLEAPDLRLVYSGDLRLTGYHPDRVMDWLIKAHDFKPDLLLLEGTTYSFEEEDGDKTFSENSSIDWGIETERALIRKVEKLSKESDDLIVFNGYPQNIERLKHIIEAVHPRQVILDAHYYALMQEFHPEMIENIRIWDGEHQLAEIKESPDAYLLQIDFERHDHLWQLPKGVYLHSNGMPLGSYMPEFEPFMDRLMSAGWQVIFANVSGHASPNDLLTVAYTIQAKVTIPWHSQKPLRFSERLNDYGLATFLPEKEKTYTIQDML